MLSQENFQFRVLEMPSPAFSAGHFQQNNMQENTVGWLSILPFSSVVSKVQCL